MLGMIWAQARGGVIGRDNDLPWHLPEDLAHFKKTTSGCPVIMGRRQWESLPERFRPLPNRRNIVLTRQAGYEAPGAEVVSDLPAALELVSGVDAWICGGGEIYRQARSCGPKACGSTRSMVNTPSGVSTSSSGPPCS